MKSPHVRIALGILAPVLALALIQAGVVATQNRYVELGMMRSTLGVVSDSLGTGLVYGAGAALFAALLGRPIVAVLSTLFRRLPGVAAGLLVAFGGGGLLWRGAGIASESELYASLMSPYGAGGAAAVLGGVALLAGIYGVLMARWPGTGWALFVFVKVCLLLWGGATLGLALTVEEAGPGRPSIVLISLDTLRADRVGCYGYARQTTPALDAFAADAVVFDNGIASSPWTLPSHASIFSSLHPHNHGADRPTNRLGEGMTTLAEVLHDRGYSTAAFTGGGYVSRKFGLAQGFRAFEEMRHEATTAIVSRAIDWLEDRPGGPFFLFVHTYEPHTPYLNTSMADEGEAGRIGGIFDPEDLAALREGRLVPTPEERRYISDLYDGDIRATDEAIARLLEWLDSAGLMDRIMVIVTSDHGEEMFERTMRRSAAHGHSLYEELIRIPMVIRYPPTFTGGRRVAAPAALVDIAPTVAGVLNFPWPDRTDGLDLRDLLMKETASRRETVLSEALRSGIPKRSLRAETLKFIMPLEEGDARLELYDLAADPGETTNVAETMATLSARYAELARAHASAHQEGREAIIGEELQEQLRALGYAE